MNKLLTVFLLLLRKITRCFYKIRGTARIADGIRRHFSSLSVDVMINDFDGTLKFYCELGGHMGSYIFWKGYYSSEQLVYLNTILKPDTVFVDIGANHGEFTLFAAKRAREGQVYSFEPSSKVFSRLVRNISLNGFDSRVRAFNLGLGESSGVRQLYTDTSKFRDNTFHEGLSNLYKPEGEHIVSENIRVASLDEVYNDNNLLKPSIIKIDVEGAELAVLKGSRSVITRFKPVIIMEVDAGNCKASGCTQKELTDTIISMGYKCSLITAKGTISEFDPSRATEFQNIVCFPR